MPSIAIGQNNDHPSVKVSYEKVNMKDGSRYLFKRLKEKTFLFLLSFNSQKKLDYYQKLLNIRLSELKYIVDHKDISNIQVASQRYFTTAGQLTNFFISKGSLTANKEAVKELFAEHIKIIEILKKPYNDTTAEWRLLRDDANYLIDYSASLK
jgi:hypothetical protein